MNESVCVCVYRLGMTLGLEPSQQQLTVNRVDTSRRATLAYSPVRGTAEVSTSEPPRGEDSDGNADDGDTR